MPTGTDDESSPEMIKRIEQFLETSPGQKLEASYRKYVKATEALKAALDQFENALSHPDANNKEAYELIGEFMVIFSHLEATITLILALEVKLGSPVGEAIILGLDFAMKIKLLRESYDNRLRERPVLLNSINAILSRCFEANETRIRVAHGTWASGQSGALSAFHFARSSLKISTYYGELAALREQIKRVHQIRRDLMEFLTNETGSDAELDLD